MSRLAKNAIELPKGVELNFADNKVKVKGPKGTLELKTKPGLQVKVEDGKVIVDVEASLKRQLPGAHGLYWSLINNMVKGTTTGFEKKLELIGVGYRAAVQGAELDLQLGFSHPTKLSIPQGIEVKVEKNTKVTISGADKQLVGAFAAEARALRPPEPYKGKGVRYADEYVRRKAGKSSK